jgi:hypothetical protein
MTPTWIEEESWSAFEEMRKKIKAPLTPYAGKLILRELCKLKAMGEDPQECLDQSIRNGWRDVYPLKDKLCKGAPVVQSRDWLDEQEQARKAATKPPAEILRMVRRA